MTIKVSDYAFDGPFLTRALIQDKPGVYLVICRTEAGDQFIDCGEASQVRNEILDHERMSNWEHNCAGSVLIAVMYTPRLPSPERAVIVEKIRAACKLPPRAETGTAED